MGTVNCSLKQNNLLIIWCARLQRSRSKIFVCDIAMLLAIDMMQFYLISPLLNLFLKPTGGYDVFGVIVL